MPLCRLCKPSGKSRLFSLSPKVEPAQFSLRPLNFALDPKVIWTRHAFALFACGGRVDYALLVVSIYY